MKQGLRKFALTIFLKMDTECDSNMGKKEHYFYTGQMVQSIPKYSLGSTRVPPSLDYPFEGVGIIIEMKWPDQVYVYTNKGEVLCLNTKRLKPVENSKK